MPSTKLIYGVGRVPKASEFVLGEIIVNVDDSKVYSKNKQNTVFEIGGGSTTVINNTTTSGGVPVTSKNSAFNTASIAGSGSFTSATTANLIISGGVGINVSRDQSTNHITVTATGDSEVTNAISASYSSVAELAYTASYVDATSIDGDVFQFINNGDQGGILFDDTNITPFSEVGAVASGLSTVDNVEFNQLNITTNITSSGNISASGLLISSQSHIGTPSSFTANASANTLVVGDGVGTKGITIYSGDASLGTIHFAQDLDEEGDGDNPVGNRHGVFRYNHNTSKFQLTTAGNQTALTIDHNSAEFENNITASGNISASNDVFAKRLRLPQSFQGNISEGGIIFGTEGSNGQILDDGNSLQIGYDGSDVLTVSGSDPYTKLLIAGNTRIASGHLKVEGNITASSPVPGQGNISASGELQAQMLRFTQGANNYIRHTDDLGVNIKSTSEKINIQGNITASGAISASSLLFASASQPAAHAGSIVAVVYDTGSGRFYYTGSYGAGGSGDDNDWFIDTNRLTSSLDVYVRGGITGSNLMITGSGGISLDPDGDHIESVALRYKYGEDSDGDSKRIVYQKTAGGNYKTLFMQDSQEFIRFENNSDTTKALTVNFYGSDIDFIVEGDTDPYLIYANAGTEKVGIGYNAPAEKLSVDGNVYSNGYLLLANKDNTVGVAGALLYSSSNEFYLGFSS